jgi:Flp pilus assembly protein TadD
MGKFSRILALGLVAALMAAPLALTPEAGALAASTGDKSSSASKDSNFARGEQAFRDGDWQEAVDYYKKAVAADPKNAEAYNQMGYSYRRLGQADPAFDAYAKALDIDPRHRGAHEYLGETYLLVGDLAKAEAALATLADLCGKQCKETVKLKKAIERYNASADKQTLLDLDEENW